ncbi:NAD(P)-dependent alcohol dehydrogenase [Microlunatus soli]|uniref:alcohol dehydrogenase (NADP(+)) n=1 Tax=Microlunatus soli TaxID=630515 RepID=A0A1H1RAI7_9ACTN|nr:NAD(P)-dependent alcohol dehydrogenase [Microlunatus soli]SDS32723.1 uncharacterized zinc-type alcohol dehydrogenase-like protein [Microlunatus soli]
MRTTTAWQSHDNSTALRRGEIDRRELRADDIAVRVDYCGVCHSDLHAIHGLVGKPTDGLVPGHEFTGVVTDLGPSVTRFALGDRVAVGTLVDSCGECRMCRAGQQNYCTQGPTPTYGGTDRIDGTPTRGGYSREYVVRDRFAFQLPAALDAAAAAPLMCAGITMWEPLRAAGVGAGSRVAIAGLGGLGHVGVKFAVALGADVTVLSRTPDKIEDARRLGATDVIITTDERQLAAAAGSFDLILDTVSAPHDLRPLIALLDLDGTLSVVGLPLETTVPLMALAIGRKKLTSSGTGGSTGTAEMLTFAADHKIAADIELLPSAQVGQALSRLEQGDVRYRFVLDLADLDQRAS